MYVSKKPTKSNVQSNPRKYKKANQPAVEPDPKPEQLHPKVPSTWPSSNGPVFVESQPHPTTPNKSNPTPPIWGNAALPVEQSAAIFIKPESGAFGIPSNAAVAHPCCGSAEGLFQPTPSEPIQRARKLRQSSFSNAARFPIS